MSKQSNDYKVQNMQFIRRAVQRRRNEGIDRFAIFPMGFWGNKTKELLENEFNIRPQTCFDNFLYDEKIIYSPNKAREIDLVDTVLLITIEDEEQRAHIYEQVIAFLPDHAIELPPLINAEKQSVFEESEKVQLDFLCAGFHKCSTTSLHAALQQNEKIFLPEVKETFFLMSITDINHRKFKQNYFIEGVDNSQALKGGIEPAYIYYAASVYQYFGPDLKILFLIRNPVEALKSAFKMSMRNVDRMGLSLIQKYEKICPALMEEYIGANYQRFRYIDYIHMYERYYPESQIKIITAEELIQNPTVKLDEIQTFIGLSEESKIKYKSLPHENKGDTVFKDIGSAYVNNLLNEFRMGIEDARLYKQVEDIRKEILTLTTEAFDFAQYDNVWRTVYKNYYAESVKALEERIGKSMEGIWY